MLALSIDGARVNVGVHRGVATQLIIQASWLQVIHCLNHRVELALKDAFTTIHLKNIEEMLLKFYYLYQKSRNRLKELRELSEAYD